MLIILTFFQDWTLLSNIAAYNAVIYVTESIKQVFASYVLQNDIYLMFKFENLPLWAILIITEVTIRCDLSFCKNIYWWRNTIFSVSKRGR